MPKIFRKFPNQNDGKSQNTAPIQNVDSQYYNVPNAPKQNGECVLCGRSAVCVCQRCGDYYCSPDCQRKDWQAHRYICFPMPNLIRSTSNVPNTTSNADGNMPVLASSKSSIVSPQEQTGKKPIPNNPNPTSNVNNVHFSTSSNSEYPEKQQQKPRVNPNVGPQQQAGKRPFQQSKVTAPPNNQQTPSLHPPTVAMPQNNSRVLLAGFRSPNRCYVRSLAEDDVDGFMVVAKTIDAYGKTAPPLGKLPEPNTYAITKLDASGVMYRVQILSRQGGNIRVLFLDTGATAFRQLSELREISDNIVKLKLYTVQVQLKDVENYEMTQELRNFLSQFEDKEFKLQVCRDYSGRGYHVLMRHWQSDELLNEQIVKFASKSPVFSENTYKHEASKQSKENEIPKSTEDKIAPNHVNNRQQKEDRSSDSNNKKSETVAKSSSSSITPVMVAPFETKSLGKSAEDIDVVVVDNSCLNMGFFACIASADIKNFSAIYDYLASFDDHGNDYTPRLDEYCIAKFEGDWYRAKVIGIPSKNQSTVIYLDYTNESTVNNTEIRPYPKDFKYPCTTSLCAIDGLPTDIDDGLHKALQSYIPLNKLVKVKVKAFEEQIPIVELEWLIEKLRKEKLI